MFGKLTIIGADERASVGDLLTARTGDVVKDWRALDSGSEALQWLRDGVPIKGATGGTYRVREEDQGHTITLRYDFRSYGQPRSVFNVDPVQVADPFRDWLDASYKVLFDRPVDPVGVNVYGGARDKGVSLSQIMAYLEADKAKGAT